MKEIVVAKNSGGPLKAIVFVCLVIVTGRSWAIWWPVRFVLLAATFTIGYVVVERYSRMKLSVTADKVHVVNFNSKFTLQLDSVMIEDERNRDAWPQDDFVRFEDGAMRNPSADDEDSNAGVDDIEDRGAPEDIAAAPIAREIKKARSLILTDALGTKAQVGVAPAYGTRLDEIAEELYIAIDRMRSINGGVA